MIKLTRPKKPNYLTPEKEIELTERFKDDGSAVWKNPQITNPLLLSSYSKCAYCECKLQAKDSYMEVEHFRHKDEYKNDVVCWENLLPSCKRCNTNKGQHDVVADPIVDPFSVAPNLHLFLQMAYLRNRDEIGLSTIEALDLNNIDRLVVPRFMITTQLESNLTSIDGAFELYIEDKTARRRNKLVGILTDTLKECQPKTEFSATAATFIHRNAQYSTICDRMRAEGLWNAELEELHQTSRSIRLDE